MALFACGLVFPRHKRLSSSLVVEEAVAGVSIHERPVVHRVKQAAHLMFQFDDRLTGVRIEDVDEAILMGVGLFGDSTSL